MSNQVEKIKWHIQKIMPAIYDDSLSYYELLSKVLYKLNEVIDQSNEYFGQNLEGIVSGLFDEMVSNGEFDDIINNTVFKDLNTRVNENAYNVVQIDSRVTENTSNIEKLEMDYTSIYDSFKKVIVTPQQFGAKGDGVSDDTEAIQSAIDSTFTSSSSKNGSIVFFPSGTYLISKSLTLHGALTIKGLGRGGSTILLAPNFNGEACFVRNESTPTYWITIQDITLDGQSSLQSAIISGLKLHSVTECLIENVNIRHFKGHGIHILSDKSGSIQPTIRNCIIRGEQLNPVTGSCGILLDSGSYDGMVSGNDIGYYKNGYGIQLNGHNGAFLSDNNMWQCGRGYNLTYSHRVRLSNCLSDYAQEYGFYLIGCTEMQFSNCQSRWSSMKTPLVYDGFHSQSISDVVFFGCSVYGGDGTQSIAGGTGQTAKSMYFAGVGSNVKVYATIWKNCGEPASESSAGVTII